MSNTPEKPVSVDNLHARVRRLMEALDLDDCPTLIDSTSNTDSTSKQKYNDDKRRLLALLIDGAITHEEYRILTLTLDVDKRADSGNWKR